VRVPEHDGPQPIVVWRGRLPRGSTLELAPSDGVRWLAGITRPGKCLPLPAPGRSLGEFRDSRLDQLANEGEW
jgi:hypothetical protein